MSGSGAAGVLGDERMTDFPSDEESAGGFDDAVPAPAGRTQADAMAPLRSLDGGPLLGSVTRVSAGEVLVTLADDEAIQRATVSALVALRAGDGFLMAIIDALACSEGSDRVTAQLMPVGSFHPAPGGGGTFRVGAADQPRVHAGCYLVEGDDLRRLMSYIAD